MEAVTRWLKVLTKRVDVLEKDSADGLDNDQVNAAIAENPAATRAVLGVNFSLASLDPDVSAYISRTGGRYSWGYQEMLELNEWVALLKISGVDPVHIMALRSEYRGDYIAGQMQSVIGSVGAIGGSPVIDSIGANFGSGKYIDIETPASLKSATLAEFSYYAVASTNDPTQGYQHVLTMGGGPPIIGPRLALVQGGGSAARIGSSVCSITSDGTFTDFADAPSYYEAAFSGIMTPVALSFNPTEHLRAWCGLGNASVSTAETVWGDYETIRIGNLYGSDLHLNGAVSAVVLSRNGLAYSNDASMAGIVGAGKQSGVTPLPVDSVVVWDGDSLMAAGTGATTNGSLPQQLLTISGGGNGWYHNFYSRNLGVGGSTISSIESQFPINASPWAKCDAFANRYYVLWGGHNEAAYQSSDTAAQLVTINRYITQLLAARALGATPVMITPLPHSGISGTVLGYEDAYVTTLKARCTAESIACVDAHNDPDLHAHTEGFYADTVHLTDVGYARVVELFLDVLPTP